MQHTDQCVLATPAVQADIREQMAGGSPLDPETRRTLERSFEIQLSEIRIHADSIADRLTRTLRTDAFAAGPHLFFRRGAYQPRTASGLGLLAHEVTHTLQQARRESDQSVADQEFEAEQAADSVVAGRPVRPYQRPTQLQDGRRSAPLMIQRHESFEHRALGDMSVSSIETIASRGPGYEQLLDQQTRLMWLWHQNPEQVTEDDVKNADGSIRTLRLQPSNLLVTYGELNALPDYLANVGAIESCPKDVLLPLLQSIRQESYYRLNQLRNKETNDRFARSPFGPHDFAMGLLNKIFNSWALDGLTRDLGTIGIDHYTGLLSRNACHFAPFTWYRWQTSYLIARDLAQKAHAATDSGEKARLTAEAWTYHGYADHFLQDSFAAGHLINKTLVMQWFIKWAASTNLFIEDWDVIRYVTDVRQPALAGQNLYNTSYGGPGTDPQTVEEQHSPAQRLDFSGVRAYYDDQHVVVDKQIAYQSYLTFLSSVITQAASNAVHDAFNERSLWVASQSNLTPYQVYGDDTFFTGANGSVGARLTTRAAKVSEVSLIELLESGESATTTEEIRAHFPTKAGHAQNSMMSLEMWATTQEQWAIDNVFSGASFLVKRIATQAMPRILNLSKDHQFSEKWETSLPDSGLAFTDTYMHGDRLFAASNSMVYELRQTNGDILQQKRLTNVSEETHIACDGRMLFAGVAGYVRTTALDNWQAQAWEAPMPGLTSWPVNLLLVGQRLFAGSNGYVVELDPRTGARLHSVELSAAYGPEVHMATDGQTLFVGCYGYAYGIHLSDASKVAWTTAMTGASYSAVQVLFADGKLFAGSNGTAHQLDPNTGARQQSLVLSAAVDEEVRLTLTDKQLLVAGCHGYCYGIRLDDWSKTAWATPMAGKLWKMVDVAYYPLGSHVYAASNGYMNRLDAVSGKLLNAMQLSFKMGTGDYTPTLIVVPPLDGLIVGMHGYVYNVRF